MNDKENFHVIELTHLQGETSKYSLFDGLDTHFNEIDQKERIKQQTSNLLKFIQNEYQKNTSKLKKLKATLDDSHNSDDYRIKGDLLYASLHLIQKGMTHVVVDNYYDNTKLDITLDPKLDPKANAQKYYQKYQKAKNSINVLLEQIDLTEKEIELLPMAVKIITLEQGIRFLTDYLNGDVYYKTNYNDQNLDRTRTQLKLVKDIEEKLNEMKNIVNKCLSNNIVEV